MQGPYLRKFGVETTINFTLYGTAGTELKVDAAHASGDTKIMKDEGDEANTTNAFTDEGQGYSIVLTATEMQAARIVLYVVDQGTKAWIDTAIAVETYGNASAMHAVDLDDSVRAGLTALPNAAADAAGGLPISDAGGLDLDAKIGALTFTVAGDVDVNVQSWKGSAAPDNTGDAFARLGAPAGASVSADVAAVKVDTAAIKAKTDNLPADPADDSDIDSQLAAIAGYIDTEIGAITTHLTDIKGATFSGATDSLEAIRDRGDAAWTTATGFMPSSADGSSLSAVPWNAAWDAEVQSEVADALNAAIPASPTADSINQYIQQLKWVTVNKMAITEADGSTTGYKDDDTTEAYSVADAFGSAAGVTTRKRLES